MGSQNARIVSEYGSWLNGNEFKLLTAYAWVSLDEPGGPNGEKPLRVFMKAQELSHRAFGEYMPDKPPKDREPYSGEDALLFKGYKKCNNRITKSRSILQAMGIVKNLVPGNDHKPAVLDLDLDRLKELQAEHFERAASEYSSIEESGSTKNVERDEDPDAVGSVQNDQPIQENRGTPSSQIMEPSRVDPRKSCSGSTKNLDIKNKDLQISTNKQGESISAQATILRGDGPRKAKTSLDEWIASDDDERLLWAEDHNLSSVQSHQYAEASQLLQGLPDLGTRFLSYVERQFPQVQNTSQKIIFASELALATKQIQREELTEQMNSESKTPSTAASQQAS